MQTPNSMISRIPYIVAVVLIFVFLGEVAAQCPEENVQNYTGVGQVVCPCFVPGEEAGAVFSIPANQYPIEILRVGIGWGSQFGGAPDQIENSIFVYEGNLPPGLPAYALPGPQLTDGFINEFDLEAQLGNVFINSGPFTVTLEFANSNVGDPFAPSVVHDGNGCQPGKNVVFAIPGGWYDACALGVTGDWVFYVVYRSDSSPLAVATPATVEFDTVHVLDTVCDTILVVNDGCQPLTITGITGCSSAPFSIDTTMTSHSLDPQQSTEIVVCVTPTDEGSSTCDIVLSSNSSDGQITIPVDLGTVTAIGGVASPDQLRILSISPNPFNSSTRIQFALPERLRVVADVWSVDGKRIVSLANNEWFDAGDNYLYWDGINTAGQPVASGVYYFRVSTRLGHRTTRAVLLK